MSVAVAAVTNSADAFSTITVSAAAGVKTVTFNLALTGDGGNSAGAISGVVTVTNCAVADNAPGIAGATTVAGSYVGNNVGDGVAGGAIAHCSIVGNSSDGIDSLSSLQNSWVVNNGGMGIRSSGGTVAATSCTIRNNVRVGVHDLLSLAGSNIFGNGGMEASDNVTGGGPDRNFENNYWGTSRAAELGATPVYGDLSFIEDVLDGSGDFLIDVWPYATGPITNAPNTTPPPFLLSVTPDLAKAARQSRPPSPTPPCGRGSGGGGLLGRFPPRPPRSARGFG